MPSDIDYASPDLKPAGPGFYVVIVLQSICLITSVIYAAIALALALALASDTFAPMLAMMVRIPFAAGATVICVIPAQIYAWRQRSRLTVRQSRSLQVLSIVPPLIAIAGTAALFLVPHTRGGAS